MKTGVKLHLYSNSVLEREAEVAIGIERTERAELGIFQEQHGFRSHAHSYQGDDKRMLELT